MLKRLLVLLPLFAALLAGCLIRNDVSIEINADESGAFSMFLGFDEEFQQLVEQSGGDGFDITEGLADVPEAWTVEEAVEGAFEGVRISTEFGSLDELARRLDELSEDGGQDAISYSDLGVTREANEFRFVIEAPDLEQTLSEASGVTDEEQIDALFEDVLEITFAVTLPGEITDSNADEVSGNRLTWLVESEDAGTTYRATSVVGSPLLPYIEQAQFEVDVDDDESGSLLLEISFADDVERPQGGDTVELSSFFEDLPREWEVADLSDDGSAVVRLSAEADSVNRMERSLTRLGEATGLSVVTGLFSDFDLTRDGRDFVFSAEKVHSGEDGVVFLADGVSAKLVLTLPGNVDDHNAHETNGGTLAWVFPAGEGGESLEATSSAGGSLLPVLAAVVAIAVAVVVGVVVVRRSADKRTTSSPPVETRLVCGACGKEVPAGARFCSGCGSAVEPGAQAEG